MLEAEREMAEACEERVRTSCALAVSGEGASKERHVRGVCPDGRPRGGVEATSGALVGDVWEGDAGLSASAASHEEASGEERPVRGVCPEGWPSGGVRETSGALVGDVWGGDKDLGARAAFVRMSNSAAAASAVAASSCWREGWARG